MRVAFRRVQKKIHEQTRDGRCLDGRIQVRVRMYVTPIKKKKKFINRRVSADDDVHFVGERDSLLLTLRCAVLER